MVWRCWSSLSPRPNSSANSADNLVSDQKAMYKQSQPIVSGIKKELKPGCFSFSDIWTLELFFAIASWHSFEETAPIFPSSIVNSRHTETIMADLFQLLLMEEIRNDHMTWDEKNPVNNGINYQPQLVLAGFLNHQQYLR